MKRIALISISSAIFTVCAACDTYPPSELFDMKEVPGVYLATNGDGQEFITLYPDSAYAACYRDSKERLYVERGRWSIHGDERGYFRLTFHHADDTVSYLDSNQIITAAEKDSLPIPYFNNVAFKKWRGDLYIVFAPGRQYKKQNPRI